MDSLVYNLITFSLSVLILPFFATFFSKIYSRYEITLIGNGTFIYFPAIPEFLTNGSNENSVSVDL